MKIFQGQGQDLVIQGQDLHEVSSRILEAKARPRGQQDCILVEIFLLTYLLTYLLTDLLTYFFVPASWRWAERGISARFPADCWRSTFWWRRVPAGHRTGRVAGRRRHQCWRSSVRCDWVWNTSHMSPSNSRGSTTPGTCLDDARRLSSSLHPLRSSLLSLSCPVRIYNTATCSLLECGERRK